MAPSPSTRPPGPATPNPAFRRLRGDLSPGEFSAAVRRAAREIGERVSCDARYVGRVESGEIRCPNYAYERVFKHMFPGRSLADLGFAPRESVRGRPPGGPFRNPADTGGHPRPDSFPDPVADNFPGPFPGPRNGPLPGNGPGTPPGSLPETLPDNGPNTVPNDGPDNGGPERGSDNGPGPFPRNEESDVLRRAFITRAPAAALAAALPIGPVSTVPRQAGGRVGGCEARSVEESVRRIRLLDDRHGADGLYARAGQCLREAYALLERSSYSRPVADRLYSGSGELAISVGWLAHDSGRHGEARSYYAEALATARAAGDPALEAHAFCNASFLARDDDRPREAVRAAQAGQQAAKRLGSQRLLSLLALREAGGWAGLGDRTACERALLRAQRLLTSGGGPGDGGPEWMTFYGEAELEGLEAQAWAALGDHRRAAAHARRGVLLQDPHFTRNITLYSAELSGALASGGEPDEAAETGNRVLDLLGDRVRSSRIQAILAGTARALAPHRHRPAVAAFLARNEAAETLSTPETPPGPAAGPATGPPPGTPGTQAD
ncbi:hypothetical protein POF50_017790 [Streptomyces sp. SL13]|uniref:Tetratricopeptide repeat protein n=1 Tax=Streptantibioticus silvisoli TaxID=2705255 RepID=A0AA90K9I3_9ACTN|nr:hypothetical protein [Streptantibioticus silvisoli]MDI5971173.1 hypothetical protein [Streptantibioticus silvisoli]